MNKQTTMVNGIIAILSNSHPLIEIKKNEKLLHRISYVEITSVNPDYRFLIDIDGNVKYDSFN